MVINAKMSPLKKEKATVTNLLIFEWKDKDGKRIQHNDFMGTKKVEDSNC